MSGADQPLAILVQIDDCQEVGRQFPVLLFHGEILLVVAHYRDQNLVGET